MAPPCRYSPASVATLVAELEDRAVAGGECRIGFLSTPSLFFAVSEEVRVARCAAALSFFRYCSSTLYRIRY